MRISCDDACASDVRLAELAKKYSIECVFYWPVEWHSLAHEKGYLPLKILEAEKIAREHYIGAHTISHRPLTAIPLDDALYEIAVCKPMLQTLLNLDYPIITFAPPRGYTNKILTDFTKTLYPFQRLTKGKDLVHIHPNNGANDNKPWDELEGVLSEHSRS